MRQSRLMSAAVLGLTLLVAAACSAPAAGNNAGSAAQPVSGPYSAITGGY